MEILHACLLTLCSWHLQVLCWFLLAISLELLQCSLLSDPTESLHLIEIWREEIPMVSPPPEKSLKLPDSHLLLMARQPRLGDHILCTLPTQSEDSQVSSHSHYHLYHPPLLKRPKEVNSESIKYFSLSSASRPLLKYIRHFITVGTNSNVRLGNLQPLATSSQVHVRPE